MGLQSLVMVFLLIILMFVIDYPKVFIPILLIIGSILFIKIKLDRDQILKEEREIAQAKDRAWEKYFNIKSKITFPVETHIVQYRGGDANIVKGNLQMWVQEGKLCFFPFITAINESMDIQDVGLFKILIDDIEHYFMNPDQETVLNYYHEGKNYSMIFANRDYKIFKKLLPEKAYSSGEREIL